MTKLDEVLEDLAKRVDKLSTRCVVALYWACSSALVTEYEEWSAAAGAPGQDVLREALAAARLYAATGIEPKEAAKLLQELEALTPPGESVGSRSSTAAQDCWICADVCIRVLVDRKYDPGPAIGYALEPVIAGATQGLFGVSQIGSGDLEAVQTRQILTHPRVDAAINFLSMGSGIPEQASLAR